eukprot:TRINITY_DN8375_c0_g1_i1.p1 TRINITY_DN8375_c0_g1~~TRINITY_DN8375_c0_g1_i1.p1  ORF type:complete len:595 (-),score=71.74 TRINITY_DN8375_c0_g1_i1:106-1845(-)
MPTLLPSVVLLFYSAVLIASETANKSAASSTANAGIYLLCVDAGSTGTRAHVFLHKDGQLTAIAEPVKVDVPLAQLNPTGTTEKWDLLGALLSRAFAAIPVTASTTELHVWGTGGMRLVPAQRQKDLYARLWRLCQDRLPIPVSRSNFRTLSGEDEGFYAWLAVNYLLGVDWLGSAGRQPKSGGAGLGTLDLGGASVQVVTGISGSQRNSGQGSANQGLPLHRLRSGLYSRSALGYGAHEMEQRLRRRANAAARNARAPSAGAARQDTDAERSPGKAARVPFACDFPGRAVEFEGTIQVGTGNYTLCQSLVSQAVTQLQRTSGDRLRLPPALRAQRYVGLSMLYHLTHFLSIVVPDLLTAFPNPSIAEVEAAGAVLCGMNWAWASRNLATADPNTPPHRLGGRCFDAALTVALLGDAGFGFPLTGRNLTFAQTVAGVELEWSLGAALAVRWPFHDDETADERVHAGGRGGGGRVAGLVLQRHTSSSGGGGGLPTGLTLCFVSILPLLGWRLWAPYLFPRSTGTHSNGNNYCAASPNPATSSSSRMSSASSSSSLSTAVVSRLASPRPANQLLSPHACPL